MEALTSLASEVLERARAEKMKMVTAESCTGGALATLFSDTAGSGDVFFGGFVSYAKEFKQAILGVPAALIAETTAVSEQVAKAMARGALKATGCDIAIAITGVTGPEPDEDGNPVGRVHVAVALKDRSIGHVACELSGETPGKICGAAIRHALLLALQCLTRQNAS